MVSHEEEFVLPSVRPRQGRRALRSEGTDENQRQEEPVRRRRARYRHTSSFYAAMPTYINAYILYIMDANILYTI